MEGLGFLTLEGLFHLPKEFGQFMEVSLGFLSVFMG
jgi:hypothetical protein